MAPLRFVFGSDLHGMREQYEILFEHARKTQVRWLFLGGDLHPDGSVEVQVKFARTVLMPLMEKKLKPAGIRVAAIFGNHEFEPVEEAWRQRSDVADLVHLKSLSLDETWSVAGCPYTPFTPWYVKDYERWDLGPEGETSPQSAYGTQYRLRTIEGVTGPFDWRQTPATDTVAARMARLGESTDPDRTVYLLHAPPADTPLDIMHGGRHVGSRAIAEFCKNKEPYLALHGHIHECVELSGQWSVRWGVGMSASSGNDPRPDEVAVVEGDLADRDTIQRIVVRRK